MATGTSSSSSLPAAAEDEILMLYGSESGWVEPKSSCDHLASLSSDLTHIPTPDTPCNRCQHPAENWLCLCCKEVLCSRFVNKHMLEHYKLTDHSLALSFSDLSVWCFSCNAYLDTQITEQTVLLLGTNHFILSLMPVMLGCSKILFKLISRIGKWVREN